MTKRNRNNRVSVGSPNGNTLAGKAQPSAASLPTDGMMQGDAYNPIRQVDNLKDFRKEAERLRGEGYTEVPGALGGGRSGGIGIDYADYINAKLSCEANAGTAGKGSLPLLHVTSGYAQPVTAENGHKGSYITWGAGNRLPNVVSLLCSLSPYTAAALKFNIDLIAGMGPKPMYQYSQYVGGNLLNKQISYEYAGTLLKGWKIDLLRQINDLKKDSGNVNGQSSAENVQSSMFNVQSSDISEYEQALRDRLAEIEADLATWEQTMKELCGDPDAQTVEEQVGFLGRNNLLQTFQQLYSDMLQYNICYPEIELQQTYTDPDTGHDVKSFKWSPKAVGIKYRNAKTVRLEQMNSKNQIEHVYTSNQWLSSPESTIPPQDGDFKIDALPALNPQCPASDLERLARSARTANVKKNARPSHVVLPVRYNEYGHPYYPVPAWYSVFSGDVYTYASLLISDRKKRRDNANVIGRILYVSDEYIQRMYIQRHLDTPEQRKEFFNKEIVAPINNFLKNRDHMGEPMLAYTFKDSDGKVYKSWEIVEVVDNDKSVAEANKEELAEISSIILFAWGVDSQLIGNTPGTTTRSGGTDLRERYLLKQVNTALMQRLVLNTMDVISTRNRWDPHLTWTIQREVLTTLDNSKTGITTAENSE